MKKLLLLSALFLSATISADTQKQWKKHLKKIHAKQLVSRKITQLYQVQKRTLRSILDLANQENINVLTAQLNKAQQQIDLGAKVLTENEHLESEKIRKIQAKTLEIFEQQKENIEQRIAELKNTTIESKTEL